MKNIICEVKEILSMLEIQHLVILLDDVSEINEDSLKTFIDTIVAPLNNWSEEFIKFKVAFYPSRVHYGKIDPGKIDVINLDFYDLYSGFDVNKMEENAIDFTKRLVKTRFEYYCGSIEKYFDISKSNIEDYYILIFQVSMNVPRIMGYILSYACQSRLVYKKPITRFDIENAALKYFNEKIDSFFNAYIYCLIAINETRNIFQLKKLEEVLVGKAKENKRRIINGSLQGKLFSQDFPATSHFYVYKDIEPLLDSLELNHFITKYEEKTDKDGKKVCIYCLNYGLVQKHNIIWGRPKGEGGQFSKYFTQRTFNYSSDILAKMKENKKIYCTSPKCGIRFSEEDLSSLEFNHFKCPECGYEVIQEITVDAEIDKLLIEHNDILKLPEIELKIILHLKTLNNEDVYARDIAEELDCSIQLVGRRCKNLFEKYLLIDRKRNNDNKPYKYIINDNGIKYIEDIEI